MNLSLVTFSNKFDEPRVAKVEESPAMKLLGHGYSGAVLLMMFGGVMKTDAKTACESPDGTIGFCVDIVHNTPQRIDELCPPVSFDLEDDDGEDCPNTTDVLHPNNML